MTTATKERGSRGKLAGEQYFNLIEHAAEGIAIIQDGVFKLVNTALTHISGYSKKELLGMSFIELLTPESQQITMKRYQARLDGKKVPRIYEIQAITKDGQVRDIEINATLTEYEGQVADEVIIRDITERKKTDEALQESEAKYKTLVEDAPIGIYFNDFSGTFLYGNKRAEEITGYKREELLGKTFLKLKLLDSKELAKAVKLLALNKLGKATGPDRFVLNRKDGTNGIVEIHTRITTVGGKRVVLGMVEDITDRKQKEEKIKKAEREKADILNSMSELVIFQDTEHRITWTNEAAAASAGMAHEQLAGRYCYEIWPQRDTPCEGCPVAKARQTGKIQEAKITTPDGRTWYIRGYPTRDANGQIIGMLEVALDITERRRMEKALRESEQFSSSLLESSPNPVLVLNPDTSIRYVNPTLEKITGFPAGELIGQKPPYPYWAEETLQETFRGFEKAIRHGDKRQERLFKKKTGERFWVEITSAPVKIDGEFKYYLANWVDITERKQAEEKLRESEQKYRTIFENVSDVIIRLDRYGRIVDINGRAEEYFGYKPEEVIGKSFAKLGFISLKDLPKMVKIFAEVMRGNRAPTTVEIKAKRKDGSPVLIEVTTALIKKDGKTEGTVAIIRDITERKKAEQALADEAIRRRILIEQSLDGIVILDVDAKVYEANQKFAEMLGYTTEEVRELHTWDWDKNFPPEQLLEMGRNVDEKGLQLETRHHRKDGSVIDVDISINGAICAGQKLIFCVCRNITQRKKMEEALRESEERYRAVIEGAHDMIHSVAPDGRINFVNQAWLDTLGYTQADLPNLNLFKVIHPDSLEHCRETFAKVAKGTPVHNIQVTLSTKGGRKIMVEGNAAPRYSGDKVVATQGIFRDITERKQMEQQLQEKNEQLDTQNEELRAINEELRATEEELQYSQERLERMFESVTDSIVVAALDGTILKVNQSAVQMHGFTTDDELLGRNSLELVAPGDRKRIRSEMIKVQEIGAIRFQECRLLKADDSEFPAEMNTSVLKDGWGNVIGRISVARDITERKQAEEREDQLQQELNLAGRLASIGQLAAGVAHEINNPLTGVIGFSHLMLSRDIPDDMKQDLQVIHSEAQRVAKIVENLLIFAHQRKTGREYVAINDIITRVLELRAYETKVNNIEVETQLDPDLPPTMADAGQLQQVFLNIVLNAEYFITKAHNKGKLLVKTEAVGGSILASFSDDGTGISQENLDKIFNPFFTTKEVGKGTGLGLSICHSIITQHQGRIYARSQPGKGATFVIELPIVTQPTQADKAKESQKETEKPRGAKILVVDDEAAILTFLNRLLTEWGHSVETINNADTALERLRKERYSLVLLDIKLPGMSGIELYHHIEEIAPALARRVMFITGDVMEGATRRFLEKTKAPYITKPLDIEVLKKMINRALNQTRVATTT